MPLPPLGQLFALFLFVLSVSAQLTTLTIGQTDSSVGYSAGWRTAIHDSQPFRLVDLLEADVQIALPNGTVSFQYIGFKRSGGAMYYVCLDCGLESNGSMLAVDAHDPAENGTQPSVELFSMANLDPTTPHSLTVFNFPDPRFQNTGQLTFDHLVASVSGNAVYQTMMIAPNPTASTPSSFSPTDSGTHPTFSFSPTSSSSSSIAPTPDTTPAPDTASTTTSAAVASTSSHLGTGSGEGSSTSVGVATTVVSTGAASATSSGAESAITVSPTRTASVAPSEPPASGRSSESLSATSAAPSSQGTVSTTPSSRARVPASVIAVVVVISVVAALSCALGIFILLKIRRLRLSQQSRTQGPPVLPEMSLPSLNFPSFRTQHRSYNSADSGSTESLHPSDSASFGPYQRDRSTVYLNVRAVSPAPVSPALPSSTMESWEDLEDQRLRNPFETEMRSVSSDDVTQLMAQRSANPFTDMVEQPQDRIRTLSGQAWIMRKPSLGQLGD